LTFLLFFLKAAGGLMLEDALGIGLVALSVDLWAGE
jgi:hypothetical protein